MPNFKKHIIIIDDSTYKRNEIKDYIRDINPNATFHEYKSYAGAMLNIRKPPVINLIHEQPENCIIFLDMMFPTYDNEAIKADAGLWTLMELERLAFHVDTVMISSDEISDLSDLQSEYDFVKGHIQFNASIYQKEAFKTAITLPDKKL